MDFGLTPGQQTLRDEVRMWLRTELPWGQGRAEPGPPRFADLAEEVTFLRHWQNRLAAGGWVAVHWPTEMGGRSLGAAEAMMVNEELARARFPELVGRIGVNLVGPTILAFGTEEQKTRWLPRILPADEIWCQLFSEPGAGSDLSSLTTRAVRRPGGWLLTGQKVWTSYAQFADWGLCLARTDATSHGGRGITAFAVNMSAPGVTVRPLVQMTGDQEFNEVFLDEVAVADDQVIGTVDHGWQVATETLGRERGLNPRQLVIHLQHMTELFELARASGGIDEPAVRRSLGRSFVDVHLFRMHTLRALSNLEARGTVGPGGSAVKLHWSEASKRMHRFALDLLGPTAVLGPGASGVPGDGLWQTAWLYYLASSIWAGTNELQRTIIGERVLGLPREPRRPSNPGEKERT